MVATRELASTARDIAWHAPWVIAARLNGFLWDAFNPRGWDTREAARMVFEKQAAFLESSTTLAMACQCEWMDAWVHVATGRAPRMPSTTQIANTANAALQPYKKRVKDNARRLTRRRAS